MTFLSINRLFFPKNNQIYRKILHSAQDLDNIYNSKSLYLVYDQAND